MSREAIEVGAFTWSRIQRLYDPDATLHWRRCESEGLQCPQEVFSHGVRYHATRAGQRVIRMREIMRDLGRRINS
jgi:hypothetical protein